MTKLTPGVKKENMVLRYKRKDDDKRIKREKGLCSGRDGGPI